MAKKSAIRLTVFLDDGRKISGVYGYLEARARADFAQTIKGYRSHKTDFEIVEESKVCG